MIKHISDGTFGRVLAIQDINTKELYAFKILLPKEEIINYMLLKYCCQKKKLLSGGNLKNL